jgi:chromosome segregation ATPase
MSPKEKEDMLHDIIKSLEEKQDKQTEVLQEIAVHMAVVSKELENINSKLLNTENKLRLVENKFSPIERHVHMVEGGFKLFGLLALVGSIIKIVLQLNGI